MYYVLHPLRLLMQSVYFNIQEAAAAAAAAADIRGASPFYYHDIFLFQEINNIRGASPFSLYCMAC